MTKDEIRAEYKKEYPTMPTIFKLSEIGKYKHDPTIGHIHYVKWIEDKLSEAQKTTHNKQYQDIDKSTSDI